MKRIGNLYEKICSYENILEAHNKAKKGKSHYTGVQNVENNLEYYMNKLSSMLNNESYKVDIEDYKKETIIDKGKERVIMKLPYFPHRVVQWSIMNVIEKEVVKTFIFDTYASIKNRGLHLAVTRIKNSLKDEENTKYCLKMDVKKFYPNIDNSILFSLLERKFKDRKLLNLLKMIIFSAGEKGQPIGSLWSQYAGNLYLNSLDHFLKETKNIKYYFRYCDDLVIMHKDKKILHDLKDEIEVFLNEKLKLELKKNWQVFPINKRGIDFLGYRFFRDFTLLRKRTSKSFKKKINSFKNKRNLNYHEVCSINSYNGWLNYCNSFRFRKKYIETLKKKKFVDSKGVIKNII